MGLLVVYTIFQRHTPYFNDMFAAMPIEYAHVDIPIGMTFRSYWILRGAGARCHGLVRGGGLQLDHLRSPGAIAGEPPEPPGTNLLG